MFLHILSEAQKSAFFELANAMVLADQKIADEEMAYMNRLYWEAGLVEHSPNLTEVSDVDLSVFADRPSRLVVAVELVVLAIVDGVYHDAEGVLADSVIEGLALTADDHARVNRIAEHVANAVVDMRDFMDNG